MIDDHWILLAKYVQYLVGDCIQMTHSCLSPHFQLYILISPISHEYNT